jgi:hypothetical protein
MTTTAKVNAPAQAVPRASFLPLQKRLSNEQHTFSTIKDLSCQRTPLSVAPLLIQRKLAIGKPDDQYEREADRVAETVMRMPEPNDCRQHGCAQTLHRQATNTAMMGEVPSSVHEALRSPGQPLDAGTRAFMEPRFGYDFSQVRIHADIKAAESARAVNALAYTVGNDMVFNFGQYAPGTAEGNKILGHELTHVIQQGGNLSMVQRWGDSVHQSVTGEASSVIKDEDVVLVATNKSEFVSKLKPYSVSTDWKARRILWTGPLFFAGGTAGEGQDHGEDDNYSSEDVSRAREKNLARQQQYIKESAEYYYKLRVASHSSGKGSHGGRVTPRSGVHKAQSGPAIHRTDNWDKLSMPGVGAIGGAIAGTIAGYGAARWVSQKVGGGFWGGLLGSLAGLFTVPLGLAVGTVAGALGIAGMVSTAKSRPATSAKDGVFAALGDACHVAQDRASHWEGVKGFGHTDPRTQNGWSPDDPAQNNKEKNEEYFKGKNVGIFGGYEVAVKNTKEVFSDWKSHIQAAQAIKP